MLIPCVLVSGKLCRLLNFSTPGLRALISSCPLLGQKYPGDKLFNKNKMPGTVAPLRIQYTMAKFSSVSPVKRLRFPVFRLLSAILPLLLASCGDVAESTDSRFVALEPLIDEQVKLLQALNPQVEKRIVSEGSEETQTSGNIDWQKELSAFRQADLSKPGLRGAYTVQEEAPNVRVYRVKPGEKEDVRELRIVFTGDNRVKSLQTLVEDQNYLYHTRRTFHVEFAERKDKWLLDQYRIDGFQKMMWSREKPFSVRAKVL